MPFDSDAPAEVTTRDRLLRLRDFLAELPAERFEMSNTGTLLWENPHCGSPACIGGWARILFVPWQDRFVGLTEVGFTRLGLSYGQADALFFPAGGWNAYSAMPAQAVKVLDHLIATGEVDWGVAFR